MNKKAKETNPDCPCNGSCERHGNCEACREYHHSKDQKTSCEKQRGD